MSGNDNRQLSILKTMYELAKEGKYCDFTIIVGCEEYPVHKNVLAAHSPYFKALFDSTLSESESNRLKLDDIEPAILQKLLKYLYTGELDLNDEDALKLILHGEKYVLGELVDRCKRLLMRNMKPEIAVRCFLVGELLRVKDLKKRAYAEMAKNWQTTFSTEGWSELVKNHSLMTEMEKSEYKLPTPTANSCVSHQILKGGFKETIWNVGDGPSGFYRQSPAFSLFDDDDLFWTLSTSYDARSLTLNLSHIGPPMVTSVTSFLSVVLMDSGKTVRMRTVDMSCCFLNTTPNRYCKMELVTFTIPEGVHHLSWLQIKLLSFCEKTEPSPMNNLNEYLDTSRFTDAIVTVGGEKFPVHKIILSTASQFFSEEFQKHDDLELNLKPETFRTLLLIIYQNQEIPEELSFDLLDATKQLKLDEKIMNRCRAAVFQSMKNEHLIDFLIQSHVQQDPVQKYMAFKHIVCNFEKLVDSGEWRRMGEHPDLHDECFKFLQQYCSPLKLPTKSK